MRQYQFAGGSKHRTGSGREPGAAWVAESIATVEKDQVGHSAEISVMGLQVPVYRCH